MSIAITAPKRFVHQDMVCVDLALRLGDAQNFDITAEPTVGEDARATWRDGVSLKMLEIQIKDEKLEVDLSRLADLLAHPTPKRADGTLLERLIADPNRAALLVMSARCSDAVSSLIAPDGWSGARRPRSIAGDALTRGLLAAIAAKGAPPPPTATVLEKARAKHLAEKVATLAVADVMSALDRVFIAERQRPEDVSIRVQGILRRDHRIPSDRLADGGARLARIIDASKGTDRDAMGAFRAELARLAPASLNPVGYMTRGVEDDLTAELSQRAVLLLSGAPRIGKTWTALALAARLQAAGYAVAQGKVRTFLVYTTRMGTMLNRVVTACPAERAVRAVEGRWKIFIIYNLLERTMRFAELQRAINAMQSRAIPAA